MVKIEPGPQHVMATFHLRSTEGAESATVVGDFNDWSQSANPMVRDEAGFSTQIPLSPGRAYRFRYLVDGDRWENDWEADAYVPNDFGTDDSVIDLTDVALAAGKPRRVTKTSKSTAGKTAKSTAGKTATKAKNDEEG